MELWGLGSRGLGYLKLKSYRSRYDLTSIGRSSLESKAESPRQRGSGHIVCLGLGFRVLGLGFGPRPGHGAQLPK